MKEKGVLYWLTGLSGAGKTTIGNALYYEMKEKKSNVILLDGDILKQIVGSDLGYSYAERFERAKRYSSLCKVLVDQGMVVIICTIAMFDEIRNWNRNNIDGYVEVYLDVDLDILKRRNQKGLYSKQQNGGLVNLVGVDMETQLPKNPDIILKNDGSLTIHECVNMIQKYAVVYNQAYSRDTNYWNEFYKKNSLFEPSRFAQDVLKEMNQEGTLLELGCGNGRDSLFFCKSGINVTAIDASSTAIEMLKKSNDFSEVTFICDDFVKSKAIFQKQYDYIYSRFTLHAINEKQEKELLDNLPIALKSNGKLFIEARSINDKIYGLGEKVEKNAYIYDNHFRRFIDIEELKVKLCDLGFSILYAEESDKFSPMGDSNPMLLRVIATR